MSRAAREIFSRLFILPTRNNLLRPIVRRPAAIRTWHTTADSMAHDYDTKLAKLQMTIGHKFKDIGLLKRALTHQSYDAVDNLQRLEFFGDSVLGFIISDVICNQFEQGEGDLTYFRSQLVRNDYLEKVAQRSNLNLRQYIRTNEPVPRMCDYVESLIGALYRDDGMDQARIFVMKFIWDPTVLNRGPRAPNNNGGRSNAQRAPQMNGVAYLGSPLFPPGGSGGTPTTSAAINIGADLRPVRRHVVASNIVTKVAGSSVSIAHGAATAAASPPAPPPSSPSNGASSSVQLMDLSQEMTRTLGPRPIDLHNISNNTEVRRALARLEEFLDLHGMDRSDLRAEEECDMGRAADMVYSCEVTSAAFGTVCGWADNACEAKMMALTFALCEAEKRFDEHMGEAMRVPEGAVGGGHGHAATTDDLLLL